jgi:hypothetical protein
MDDGDQRGTGPRLPSPLTKQDFLMTAQTVRDIAAESDAVGRHGSFLSNE